MVIIILNQDLSDIAKYYWVNPGDGSKEEECEFNLRDWLSKDRVAYPVDSEVYSEMIWPQFDKKDMRKVDSITAVALDPPGSQTVKRTTWVPTNCIEIKQV